MTYCAGILVQEGLVMIADTRTNAGVDNISTFRKLYTFGQDNHHQFILASAGNLAITQSIISHLEDGLENPETGESETLNDQKTTFKAAEFVGRAIRHVYANDFEALNKHGMSFDVSILLGGQTKKSKMRLFMIYAAGNFIEATHDTPYLQIGEHKYGKPILDRAIMHETSLSDATKIALISMDSTMRSNISVGMPIDLITMERENLTIKLKKRIEKSDSYFTQLRQSWSSALRAAHQAIPRPPYKT